MVPQVPPQTPHRPSRTIFVSHAHADNTLWFTIGQALGKFTP